MRDVKDWPSFCNKDESTEWRPLIYLGIGLILILLALTTVGCASKTSQGTKIPTYEEAKKEVLSRGPLADAPVETEHSFLQNGKKAAIPEKVQTTIVDPEDSKKTKQVAWGAIVIDEKKAAELGAIKVQRDLLIKKLEATRLQLEANKIIYDAALKKAQEAAQRTWWERNKATFALATGGTLGAALIIGVVYALTRGKAITVSTNPMVLEGIRR